jgi:hypothetical protein
VTGRKLKRIYVMIAGVWAAISTQNPLNEKQKCCAMNYDVWSE